MNGVGGTVSTHPARALVGPPALPWALGALLALGCLCEASARVPEFDWRERGVLFRVVADDPRPPAASPPLPTAGTTTPELPDATGLEPARAPNYLFATMHYGSAEQLGLNLAALRGYLRGRSVLVNEIDGDEPWRSEYEPYRRLPSGMSLRKLLGEQTFAVLTTQLPDAELAASIDGLKPWVAMSILEAPGAQPGQSIDHQLQVWAREDGVRLQHLENLVDQLAALDCVPAEQYALVLGQRLRNGWSWEEEAARTTGYYRDRDLPAWLDEIERMPGLDADAVAVEQRARHCLIEARNARWLPVLEKLLRRGDCFVAVGAIHLTGAQGLLAELNRRGFTVTVEPW